MKKMVCVLLAVLVLAGGATAFAADGNSGKETVIPYYDIGVTVTMPPAYREVIGNIYTDNYGMLTDDPELRVLEYSYSSLPKETFRKEIIDLQTGTRDREEKKEFWDAWGPLAMVFSIKNGDLDYAGAILSIVDSQIALDAEHVTELGTADDYHFYLYMGDTGAYAGTLDEEHAKDYAAAREMIKEAYLSAEYYAPADPMKAMVGTTLAFETKDLDGSTVTSEELFGENEITMVHVWATWNDACKEELKELAEIHRHLQEKGCGIVGVVTDGVVDPEAAKSLVKENGLEYPNVFESEDMYVLSSIKAVPTTVFVDRNGVILGEPIIGAAAGEYEKTADALLAAQGQA